MVLADKDSKRAAAKGRKKVSGGHFFSPGKSPIERRLQVLTCKRLLILWERMQIESYIVLRRGQSLSLQVKHSAASWVGWQHIR